MVRAWVRAGLQARALAGEVLPVPGAHSMADVGAAPAAQPGLLSEGEPSNRPACLLVGWGESSQRWSHGPSEPKEACAVPEASRWLGGSAGDSNMTYRG